MYRLSFRITILLLLTCFLAACMGGDEPEASTPTREVRIDDAPNPTATRLPNVTMTPAATVAVSAELNSDTFTCRLVSSISESECEALVGIYFATQGNRWGNSYPNLGERWLTSEDPCSWHGVTCLDGAVTQLDLRESQLRGTLTSAIRDLTSLDRLIAYKNELSGPLPAELGEMSWLRSADLSNNQFRGGIPESWDGMLALEALNLNYNRLDGALPQSLETLATDGELGWLDVSFNDALRGPIPVALRELSFSNFQGTSLESGASSGGGTAAVAAVPATLRPSPSPTQEPTDPPTTEATKATETATPTATATSKAATTTASPSSTATQTGSTLTPTRVVVQATDTTPSPTAAAEPQTPQIVDFDVNIRYLADGSEDVTLTWTTTGADSVTVWTGYSPDSLGVSAEVGPSGTHTLRWDDASLFFGGAGIIATKGNDSAELTYNLRFQCTSDYYFDADVTRAADAVPTSCPLAPPTQFDAGYQQFENGFMLYLSGRPDLANDRPSILVFANGRNYTLFDDTWDESQPVRDVLIVPPDGKFQPQYGFGKVWRENDWVRDALSWATTEESAFSSTVQAENLPGQYANGSIFISLPSPNSMVNISTQRRNNQGGGWRVIAR